jgi:beta-xylosidase
VLLVGLCVLLTAVGAVVAPMSPADPAAASTGADRFWAGQVYTGEFGAPSLLQVGTRYYAYATNADGDNLPVMTSNDLVTWRARDAWPPAAGFSTWKGYNDAMPFPARWAARMGNGKPSVWAPAVAALGGRYVDAYAVQMRLGSGRHCLTLATSPSPTGPFRDRSTKPFYCSSDPNGSIDPAWLQVHGKVYLIWKNAGVRHRKPTQVMVRRTTADGLHFAPGSRAHVLLQTAQPWEGNVIEAPSAAVYHGRIYLFYSGNIYSTARYAIGYAVCTGPLGPCKRPSSKPLLASGGSVAGPGAESPIVDANGDLRLAYSAWTSGHVGYPDNGACRSTAEGCNQRRLHVATLAADGAGRLTVTQRG